MKLGLVQTKHNALLDFIHPAFPYTAAQCEAMRRAMVQQNLNLLESAAGKGYDLLVTTECINYIRTAAGNRKQDAVRYPKLDCADVAALSDAAKAAKSYLVAGFGYRSDDTHAHNAALIFDRKGNLVECYHKNFLAGDEKNVFTQGERFVVIHADFGCFAPCICWDLQQPELARQLAAMGADVVVCPTWGWEENLYGRARAYENGIYVAAAMAVPGWGDITGERTPSSVVAPNGEILVRASSKMQQLLSCEFTPSDCAEARAMRLHCRRETLFSTVENQSYLG